MFPTGPGSHFIAIHTLQDPQAEFPPPTQDAVTACVVAMKARWQAEEQARAQPSVDARAPDEANPWLRRTQWAEYLADCDVMETAESMRLPVDA